MSSLLDLIAVLHVRLRLPNNMGQFVSQKAHALRTSASLAVLDDMDPRILSMSSHIRAYGSPLTQVRLEGALPRPDSDEA